MLTRDRSRDVLSGSTRVAAVLLMILGGHPPRKMHGDGELVMLQAA